MRRDKKVLFWERFQKKINETIKPKMKTKELLKKYTKPTPAKRPYHYGSCQPPFRQGLIGMGASIIPKSRVRAKRWPEKILFLGRKR